MSFINYVANEITCKIVYCGPSCAGKTTNLQWIYHNLQSQQSNEVIQLPFDIERTLFFDFLPLALGKVQGINVKFHLYSVPGELYLKQNRKIILNGVDGIVFVADCLPEQKNNNMDSLKDIQGILSSLGYNIKNMPFVFQYNKTDSPNALDINEMRLSLNRNQNKDFLAKAIKGEGVLNTFKGISQLILAQIQSKS
ncbi:MAG: gliding-motility protein MglA [Bdellovibrionaceae bacterium]|nr:gliding-motility protein MglA [Pseudobdellovibrionaceae bacterium]